jgi:hypothetical protein
MSSAAFCRSVRNDAGTIVPDGRGRTVTVPTELTAWLEGASGPLNRDWLVFGSAPNATIPARGTEGCLLVCVNNSGLTASRLGLKAPDLAIRAEHKSWAEVAGLSSRAVLWISERSVLRLRFKYPGSLRHRVGSLRRLPTTLRDEIMAGALGITIGPGERDQRPSNGIFAITLALSMGAPRVIVSGLSLSEQGHSYNDLGETRKQIDPDQRALARIAARYPHVVTTEADLSEATGLPLVG